MKYLEVGDYISPCSDLKITVHSIFYRGSDYVKAKITLTNKNNGIFYQTLGLKLYKKNIENWEKL